MQTRKSKYMTQNFELNVNKGMVLGKNGDWRSIDEVIDEEKELIIHLENGEVFHNGEWIPIIEAIAEENIDIQSEPVLLDKNRVPNPEKTESYKHRLDKSSHLKIKHKRDFYSQSEVKKSDKRKKKKGIKKSSHNIRKVKEDSLPIKEDKILLADVNIKVDTKKADIINPKTKKDSLAESRKPKSENKIIGNENKLTEIVSTGNSSIDYERTQMFEKIPSTSQKTINNPPGPGIVSSDRTLVKKLSKEISTFDDNITQAIPLSIHIFKGKQIKAKKGKINSRMEKNRSLPDETLDEWAEIRSNFIKNTMLFSISALLVFICFYFLYYFVIL